MWEPSACCGDFKGASPTRRTPISARSATQTLGKSVSYQSIQFGMRASPATQSHATRVRHLNPWLFLHTPGTHGPPGRHSLSSVCCGWTRTYRRIILSPQFETIKCRSGQGIEDSYRCHTLLVN